MSRIVVAPDSFKGTLSAAAAAVAITEGWLRVRPDDEVSSVPMADGGEGTLAAFEAAIPGARRMPVTVQGPANESIDTAWLLLPGENGGTGVVELGCTSGIELLGELRPLDANTLGFGQAIAAAIDAGVHRLILAIGSSASTDGGSGVLAALGATLTDSTNRPIRLGGRGLGNLARMDLSRLRPVPPGGAIVLSDVTNPLLGANGAAAVFGPQKGANVDMVDALDRNLERWAEALALADAPGRVNPDAPGAGAAGGTGFGLVAWGAEIRAGGSALAEALRLPEALAGAALVITGEGRFDAQSLDGKVPSTVLELAVAAGVPVDLVAGAVEGPVDDFRSALSLTALAGSAAAAMADPARWLREAGGLLAATFGADD